MSRNGARTAKIGSRAPQVRIVVPAGSERPEQYVKSKVMKKNQNPVWKEVFVLDVAPDRGDDWSLDVRCVVEEYVRLRGRTSDEAQRRRFDVEIFSDESRRRRGRDVDSPPRRDAAAPP